MCRPFTETALRSPPVEQAEPAPGDRGGSAPSHSAGKGRQGQHADLLPTGWGVAGKFILGDVCNKTLCLWNEWSARKMSLSRRFTAFLIVK